MYKTTEAHVLSPGVQPDAKEFAQVSWGSHAGDVRVQGSYFGLQLSTSKPAGIRRRQVLNPRGLRCQVIGPQMAGWVGPEGPSALDPGSGSGPKGRGGAWSLKQESRT